MNSTPTIPIHRTVINKTFFISVKLQLLVVRRTTNIMYKKMTMGINTSHCKNTWVFPASGFL